MDESGILLQQLDVLVHLRHHRMCHCDAKVVSAWQAPSTCRPLSPSTVRNNKGSYSRCFWACVRGPACCTCTGGQLVRRPRPRPSRLGGLRRRHRVLPGAGGLAGPALQPCHRCACVGSACASTGTQSVRRQRALQWYHVASWCPVQAVARTVTHRPRVCARVLFRLIAFTARPASRTRTGWLATGPALSSGAMALRY